MIAKEYRGDWYTQNSILGNEWAIFIAELGGRDCGKSYSAMKWAVNRKLKRGYKTELYWMRLTDKQAQKLLASGGEKLIDPDIKRKTGLKTFAKNGDIYIYQEKKDEKGNVIKEDVKKFCGVLSCSTFYNEKGVASFDADFAETPGTEYIFILDEFEKEQGEKSQGDILYQFVNALHNKCRHAKNVKVIMCGNTLQESSEILAAFNFIPVTYGRYKLKRKKAVIDYIKPTKKYLERQKGTVADILLPNASTFTNKNDSDMISRDLLVNRRRCVRASSIIMFGITTDKWYTLWNDGIIKTYNKETVKNFIPMKRYLNAVFDQAMVDNVFDRFDAMNFKFVNLVTFLQFKAQLQLIRKK